MSQSVTDYTKLFKLDASMLRANNVQRMLHFDAFKVGMFILGETEC